MIDTNELYTVTKTSNGSYFVQPNYELVTLQRVLNDITKDIEMFREMVYVSQSTGMVICHKGQSAFYNTPEPKKVPFILDTEELVDDVMARLSLRKIRRASKITQKELSDISGLSTQTISNIESDDPKQTPTMKSVIKYAGALGYEMKFEKK